VNYKLYILGLLLLFFSCKQREKPKTERINYRASILHDFQEKDGLIVINLNIIYDSLKPHFKFTKEKSLKKVYSYLNKYGYLKESIEFKPISFEFSKDTTGFELSEYYTFIIGSFLYQEKEFYVFFRGVDADGYYNGISFLPVNGKKKYTDIKGKMKNGKHSNLRVRTTFRNKKLYYKKESNQRIKSLTGEDYLFPKDYLEEKELGYYIIKNDSITKQIKSNEKYILRHYRRGSIDTLVYRDSL